MEGSPDSQGHAMDWRFAVCSFRDAWDEEIKDPSPPRPSAGAAQGDPLQGSLLPGELQSAPGQKAADGSRDGQRGILGGSSTKSEEPVPSGEETLLCPVSSHLSLAQGESASQGGGLARDPVPGRVVSAGLGSGALDRDSVDFGDPLFETSELLEADPSGSSLPKPADNLLAQDLTWELLASGMAALPGLGAELSSDSLQEIAPGSVHQVLLVGKMPEEVHSRLQLEQLPSHQSVLTHISTSVLPASLGGGLPYCHQAWLDFRMVSVLDRA
ncbi:Puratrophin-1 [Pteropus alecto]|uniref:Puratrophin-1 n=1 Tax=Pteropus alecto TaxID=9402 RepID=L5KSQ1_PTEAL|nr:Puratrophin-1 [Pteropus alecto]